jgi:hypothetical protein
MTILYKPIEPGAYAVVHHVIDNEGELRGFAYEGVLGFLVDDERLEAGFVPVTVSGPHPNMPLLGPHDEVTHEGAVFVNADAYFKYVTKTMQ